MASDNESESESEATVTDTADDTTPDATGEVSGGTNPDPGESRREPGAAAPIESDQPDSMGEADVANGEGPDADASDV